MKKPISPILIRLFALLLFVAVGSGIYLLMPDKVAAPTPPLNQSSISTTQKNLPIPTLPSSTIQTNHTTKLATTSLKKSTPELQSATLQTPNHTYALKFSPNTTLLEVMRQLTIQSAQSFTFSGKEYPSLGFFVEEINGTKNDLANEKYWIYYINGKPAQIGISNYKIKQNDLIEWKYETSKF
jgi:hypothetical protein